MIYILIMEKQLEEFSQRWINKADNIQGEDMNVLFDKFFSLYIVYNKLYTEVTHTLSNEGKINLNNGGSFPDQNAATSYVIQYLGCNNLRERIEGEENMTNNFEALEMILEHHLFNICLNPVTGHPNHRKDRELLAKIRSNSCNEKFTSILEFIYQVRCNMFHGRKGYEPVQEIVLQPVVQILDKVVKVLFASMKNREGNQ